MQHTDYITVEIIMLLVILISSMFVTCECVTKVDTAIIYDDYYKDSLPSFYAAINNSTMDIHVIEFYQGNMTNIVGNINRAKVSSLFILTRTINCTAMIELKRAVTVFIIGMMKEHCDPGDNFLLYMFPSHYDVMQALYDGISAYQWKTAAVFYDGSEDLAFGYPDLDLARQRGINLKVWVIPENEDATWDVLKSVRLLGYRTYILLCDYKKSTSVLTKAVFLSMVSEVNHWILPNLETHPLLLQDFLESSVRLTLLSATSIRKVLEYHFAFNTPERVTRDAVITAVTIDSLNRIRDACNLAVGRGCFAIPLSNDKQCGIDQGAKSVETSETFYSLGTCTEIYMRTINTIGATKIEFLEHHLGNAKGNLSFVGYWKDNFKPIYVPFVQAAIVFPEEPLTVGIVYESPWLIWHVNEIRNETTYEGFLMDLLTTLSSQLNFKYKLVFNEKLGPSRPNDSVADEEVNRMLMNKEVEFVLQKRSIHGDRLGTEELSIGFQQVSYFMLTLASGNQSPVNIWQFLAPFTFDSWAVLWGSLVFVSAVLALVNHFNPFEWRKQALDETNEDVPVENFNKLGLGNSIWMAYAGIVGQGVDVEPMSYAGRVITGTWWYFTMLVIAAYTANLTAFLTQEFAGDITTLDELVQQEYTAYGVLNDSDIVKYFFPYATSPLFTKIWDYLMNDHPEYIFNSTDAVLERISQGGFYLLAPFGEIAKAEQSGCTYARTGGGFLEYQYGLAFQVGSRYTSVFNDAISSLRDDGSLQELEEKWFTFRSECKEATFDIESNRLGIGNLGGMFILLLMGSVIAVTVHIGEILWSKRRQIKIFRDMEDEKEIKDDPISEMKRRRQQEKRELDQKIEARAGGYQYWMDRMDHINTTLQVIDDQNKIQIRQIKGQAALDEEEQTSETFSWWTGTFKSINNLLRVRPSRETNQVIPTYQDEAKNDKVGGGIVTLTKKVDLEDKVIEDYTDSSSSGIGTSESSMTTEFQNQDPAKNKNDLIVELPIPSPSSFSNASSSVKKSKKIKKMLSFSQRKPKSNFNRF